MKDGILGQLEFLGHSRRRKAIKREPAERLPGRRVEIGLNDREQPREDVPVVALVPLPGQLAVRRFQPVEEPIGRVQPVSRSPASPPVAPGLAHGNLPEPLARERKPGRD